MSGLLTEHVKFVAPAKRLFRQGRNSFGVFAVDQKNCASL